MGQYYLKLPKMGESIEEATITKWIKNIGDSVSLDEPIVEIATDKVDTDVTSEVEGIILEQKFNENDVVQIGEVLAIIETDSEIPTKNSSNNNIQEPSDETNNEDHDIEQVASILDQEIKEIEFETLKSTQRSGRYYSPLVRSIAKKEGIESEELEKITGTGKGERLTKKDLINYLKTRETSQTSNSPTVKLNSNDKKSLTSLAINEKISISGEDKIIEMSRMEKLISEHMKSSLETAAHVQSFIEVDVTNLWEWREKVKDSFYKRENEKLTFTPLFITAIVKALRDYPALNGSINGDKIVIKKDINLGMATALSDGNLIVPVIKNADHLNLVGLTKAVNDLANRARTNNLKPDEIKDGTYTFTNIGNFGSIMGTPIINQPQVGILAIGVIRKTPSVIETPNGDFVGIRKKVILSHSYDHRIINGATGGLFVKRVAEYLENWDEALPF